MFINRLCCTDGSEFLFLADTSKEMEEWVNKITFHAQLPPSLQLLSYDDNQKVCINIFTNNVTKRNRRCMQGYYFNLILNTFTD
jgi:hypothetical protein